MSSKALYRKYRPTQLADVVGQAQVTDALSNSLKQGKISHAYLFIGPRGTGKTSVARIFAHAVNDFDYQVEDNYLDIVEIDAASNTGVDNIRELREKAVIAPTKGKYKVYIIDEVHMLTKSASNALLKTLEEPPEHVIFILATTDAHKVPITISSRTQVFTFKLASPDTMFSHLQKISQQEHIDIDDDALKLIVRRGGGSYRDSLSLLDQVATLSEGKITESILSNALGLPQDQAIQDLLSAYRAQDLNQIQQVLKDLLNTGIKPELIAAELLRQIIDQPQPKLLPLLDKLPDVQPPFPEAKLLLALLANSAPATSTPAHTITTTPTPPVSPNPTPIAPATTAPAPADLAPTTPEPPSPDPTPSSSVRDQLLAKRKAAAARRSAPKSPESEATEDDMPSQNATFAPVSSDGSFDWENFLETVRADNGAVYAQLQKSDYEFVDNVLQIYPDHKLSKSILDKPGNSQILARHLGGLSFKIHEVGERQAPKDETLSKISAIMGEDIREVKGDSPF